MTREQRKLNIFMYKSICTYLKTGPYLVSCKKADSQLQ